VTTDSLSPARPLRGEIRPLLPHIRRGLWVLWWVAVVLGAWGLYLRVSQGHLPAGYGSYVPWGLWIALYFHGVGLAGGAFVFGAGGFLLDLPGFRHRAALRATIVLSFAAIVPAFLAVWLDLGHMARAGFIFLHPRFTSMMAFNAWMYNAFIVVAALAWVLTYRPRAPWLKPLLSLGLLFTVLFPSQSGAFFGVVDAKPYWHTALLPMVFLTSALTAGSAALLVMHALLRPGPLATGSAPAEERDAAIRALRWATLVGLTVYFLFEFAEISIELWNPTSTSRALELVLWGPYWWVFWIVHLLLGGLVPVALLLTRSRRLWLLGGVLTAVCFLSSRLNVLVPGQAVGEIQGLQEAFHHPRLTYLYHATAMEYLVGFFLLAVGMTIFYLGWRLSRALAARQANRSAT
jgi:protein NrfD